MPWRLKGYFGILFVCIFYWVLDSAWSYYSFDYNIKKLIFTEPGTFLDTILLKVSPFQIVSRLLVIFLFISLGALIVEYFSKKKTAEKELRENGIFLKTLINAIPSPVFYKDKDGNYLGFNRAFEEFFGETKENLIGKSVFDINPLELAKTFHSKDKELLESGKLQIYESQVENVQGHSRNVVFHKATFDDADGNTIGLIGFIIDITERKKNESRLLESEKKFKTLFDIIPLAISITEIESGMIGDVNIKFTEVCKFSKDELIGKDFIGLGIYSIDTRAQLKNMIQTGGSANGMEIDLTIKDGSKITCLMFACEIQLLEISYFLTVFLDISDKKRLEADLLQAHKMEAIGTLAGGIAHDFNNVLAAIIGFTELALDEAEVDTSLEDDLQEVYKAGKRAKDLVWQILAFARQSEEKPKPIQVKNIAKEVLKFIRSTIPTTVEIESSIESDSLVLGNPTQIHQIIMNLCTNAAHAMEDKGGTLLVTLKDTAIKAGSELNNKPKPGDYIELKVSDTGDGIPPEILDSIFEPYFTTKAVGEGTGMGLAVVHGIVESNGGKINVESQLGHGTIFTVYLPIMRKRGAERVYEAEMLPTGTEHILLVDDEAPIAKMGSRNLEGLGYAVTTRTSSIEALELFRSKPNEFDLIITDMTMPNMTGDMLTVELMAIRPDIPVILCTGYSKKMSEESASEIGIKAFTYKPLVKADLAKTVRKVLDEAKS